MMRDGPDKMAKISGEMKTIFKGDRKPEHKSVIRNPMTAKRLFVRFRIPLHCSNQIFPSD
jgi:hypothetical protein